MQTVDGILCISHEELTGRIITTSNLNALVRRGKVRQVVKGGNGRQALFDVSSLPLKWRTEVYKRFPDAKESTESRAFMDTIEPDGAALMFFQDFTLPDGRHLPDSKQLELSNNCAIMNAFRKCIEDCQSVRGRSGKKPPLGEFWKKAAASLEYIADRFPHSLPKSARRLSMKFAEYLEQGPACFVSAKYCNGNAAKVATEDQIKLLTTVLSHHNNLDYVTAAGYYNDAARALGWDEITPATIGVWAQKLGLVISAGRLGVNNFRNTRTMQVKRSRPTAPFLMWTLDGWTVELLYQSTKTDKKGHSVTTYTNRLTMVVVLDPCIDYPIGYAVGSHECPALIKEALRNAARHSRELFGEMLRANQVQSDRYGIKAMTPLYAIMGDKVTPTRAHNSKGKVIEPYFRRLNDTYCKRFNNWGGYGITSNPKRQPNSEALNRLRHSFPDEAGVRAQIDQMMQWERATKVEKFRALMDKLPAERRLPMSREQYLLNFGVTTGYKNALEGCGLRPTILGVKMAFDCFDLSFREHADEQWTVVYDPDDLSDVLAVNDGGTRRYMLEQKYVQPMALADRKPGDAEQLERVNDFNKQLEAQTAQRLALAYERTEQLIAATPALRGSIEDRLLITDSRGQHKDQRSRKRLGVEDIEALEVETVEVPIVMQGERPTDRAEDVCNYGIF